MYIEEATQNLPKDKPIQGRRSRRGTDLFSAVLYLIIFVVVIAGVVAIYSSIMTGVRNAQLQTQVMRTASSVEASYRAWPTYDNGSLLTAIRAGGAFSDSEIYDDAGTLRMLSPFGTEMTVVGDGSRRNYHSLT